MMSKCSVFSNFLLSEAIGRLLTALPVLLHTEELSDKLRPVLLSKIMYDVLYNVLIGGPGTAGKS